MISLQNRLRIYIILSIVVNIITAISVFILDLRLSPALVRLNLLEPDLVNFLDRLYIALLVVTVFAILYGIVVFVFVFVRGVNKYRDLARRLASIETQSEYNLKSIEFPREDEFGNLGSYLSLILKRIAKYDDLKLQRIRIENQKFKMIADKTDIPVLVIAVEDTDKRVKYYNESFQNSFTKKEKDVFFDIRNTLLTALNIQAEKKETKEPIPDAETFESFLDDEFIQAIDFAIADKSQTTIKKDIRSLDGKERYHSDNIEIVPFWNDYGEVTDVMLLFNKIRKR